MTTVGTRRNDYVATFPTVGVLAKRNLVRLFRMPAILVPMIVMPLFFVIAFTGSFDGISRVEGYPTAKIINWVATSGVVATRLSPECVSLGTPILMKNLRIIV